MKARKAGGSNAITSMTGGKNSAIKWHFFIFSIIYFVLLLID